MGCLLTTCFNPVFANKCTATTCTARSYETFAAILYLLLQLKGGGWQAAKTRLNCSFFLPPNRKSKQDLTVYKQCMNGNINCKTKTFLSSLATVLLTK